MITSECFPSCFDKLSPKTTTDEIKANLEKDVLDTSKNYIKNSSPKATIDETKIDLVKDDFNIGNKVDADGNRDGEPRGENTTKQTRLKRINKTRVYTTEEDKDNNERRKERKKGERQRRLWERRIRRRLWGRLGEMIRR